MKALFEVTNGYGGNAYVRVYAWAHSEADALDLARERFKQAAMRHTSEKYWTDLTARELFTMVAHSFATLPSDEGWEVEE